MAGQDGQGRAEWADPKRHSDDAFLICLGPDERPKGRCKYPGAQDGQDHCQGEGNELARSFGDFSRDVPRRPISDHEW